MADGFSTEVVVKRRARDGWSSYTCDELPGLFVASKNDQTAYNDVPKSIQALLKLDLGLDCVVTHVLTYPQFLAQMRVGEMARQAVADRTDELTDHGVRHLSFAVHPVAHAAM